MSGVDAFGVVKGTVAITSDLVKLANENDDAKAAGRYAAKSAKVLAETLHTVLMPLAALNYGAHKAQAYFQNRFAPELQATLDERVPDDHRVPPKTSVAGYAMQGLAFAHEEDELRQMYLELLATAMDGRAPEGAHPGFVEVIKQLTASETHWLQSFVRAGSQQPVVELRESLEEEKNNFRTVALNIVDARDEQGGRVSDPGLQVAINNWERLGLVQIVYGTYLTDEGAYAWADSRPEYIERAERAAQRGHVISVERGVMTFTAFGLSFARAVGMLPVVEEIPVAD